MVTEPSACIGAAVDLGSTTIAIQCMDIKSGTILKSATCPNPQYLYGADIITRIQYCIKEEHMAVVLKNIVQDTLQEQLQHLLGEHISDLKKIVISGNTVMQHILRGFPVNGLSMSPFTPFSLEAGEDVWEFDGISVPVFYPQGLSAFVGADVISGGAFLQMGNEEDYEILIDLGTNGEILLLNDKTGLATSTACGPVFDHAVSGAGYGNESIHAIANCIQRGLIDETGTIADVFFDKGIKIAKNFVIQQGNVRNFQLAKAAIYSGIICMKQNAGITWEQISKIYISGGLGFHMQLRDAFIVGLLPQPLKGKTIVSGNSSLSGAIEFLRNPDSMKKRCAQIVEKTTAVELANLEHFQEEYIKAMYFSR